MNIANKNGIKVVLAVDSPNRIKMKVFDTPHKKNQLVLH